MTNERDFILKAAIALYAMTDDIHPSPAFDEAINLNAERIKRGYLFDDEKPKFKHPNPSPGEMLDPNQIR